MTRSIFRSLCDVWGLLLVALLVVIAIALFVDDADARSRVRTIHMDRGEVMRVVTHAPAVCVFVANRTVDDDEPRQVTRIVARPCPPSVEPDITIP